MKPKYIKPWSKTDSMRWLDERSDACVRHWPAATTTKSFGSWLRTNFIDDFDIVHDRIVKIAPQDLDASDVKALVVNLHKDCNP